jgi:hypothetical protein
MVDYLLFIENATKIVGKKVMLTGTTMADFARLFINFCHY